MDMGSAVLAHFLLKEKLQKMDVLGCLLCIVGSTVVVLHAPDEKSLTSVLEIWELATQPGILSSFHWFSIMKLLRIRFRFSTLSIFCGGLQSELEFYVGNLCLNFINYHTDCEITKEKL